VRALPLAIAALIGVAHPSSAQDALRGKLLYHDVGRLSGAGVSCIDCHGGVPGALHGLGKVADNPAAIDYAIGAVLQMTSLRGRLSARDFADIAAYVATPTVGSPEPRVSASGPAASPYSSDRLEFFDVPAGSTSPPTTLSLANRGTVALRIGSNAAIAGPDAAQFAIAADDCRAGQVLEAGQQCTVTIVFRPEGPQGLRTATLRLAHDWIYGGVNVPLIGRVR
jgi:mono/diheme cytochrome c family protein